MNGNSIRINSNKLPIREYNGQRVVTFKDIDTVHIRPEGTARKRFNDNKKHFTEGVDYFNVQMSEKRTLGFDVPNRGLILITESGYLMLAKSFTDDLAWKVQRELVNNYFRGKSPEPPQAIETSEYHYFPKTLKGEPVITLADFEHFTGVSRNSVCNYAKKLCKRGEEYFLLSSAGIVQFKRENPSVSRLVSELIVLKASAVRKLLKYFGLSVEIPMIEEKKAEIIPVEAPEPRMVNTDECIVALNVLRYRKHSCVEFREEEKERGDMGMVKRYDEEIAAIDTVMKSVGIFVATGY